VQPPVPRQRRDLVDSGAGATRLDMDLRAGRSVALYRGVYVAAGHANGLLVRVTAAVRTQGSLAVATYTTSAALHGFRWLPSTWSDPASTVHLAVEASSTSRHQPGLRLHRRLIASEDVALVGGVPCFAAGRTLVELARSPQVPRLLAVQILDGALLDRRVTKDELEMCIARFPGERGIARARELVRCARERVDSPRETQMRLTLEDGGLPPLDVPLEIRDEFEGAVLACGDLGYWRFLIWGEYDGFVPHTQRKTFRTDRVGDRWLARRGWHVMRFVDDDFTRPGILRREWEQAIADAPARLAALPTQRSPELAAAKRTLGLA